MERNKIKYSLVGLFIGFIFGISMSYIQIFLDDIKTSLPIYALKNIIEGIRIFVAPIIVILPFSLTFIAYCTIVGILMGYISTMRKGKGKMIITVISLLVIQWLLLIIADINLTQTIDQFIKYIYGAH